MDCTESADTNDLVENRRRKSVANDADRPSVVAFVKLVGASNSRYIEASLEVEDHDGSRHNSSFQGRGKRSPRTTKRASRNKQGRMGRRIRSARRPARYFTQPAEPRHVDPVAENVEFIRTRKARTVAIDIGCEALSAAFIYPPRRAMGVSLLGLEPIRQGKSVPALRASALRIVFRRAILVKSPAERAARSRPDFRRLSAARSPWTSFSSDRTRGLR